MGAHRWHSCGQPFWRPDGIHRGGAAHCHLAGKLHKRARMAKPYNATHYCASRRERTVLPGILISACIFWMEGRLDECTYQRILALRRGEHSSDAAAIPPSALASHSHRVTHNKHIDELAALHIY